MTTKNLGNFIQTILRASPEFNIIVIQLVQLPKIANNIPQLLQIIKQLNHEPVNPKEKCNYLSNQIFLIDLIYANLLQVLVYNKKRRQPKTKLRRLKKLYLVNTYNDS